MEKVYTLVSARQRHYRPPTFLLCSGSGERFENLCNSESKDEGSVLL